MRQFEKLLLKIKNRESNYFDTAIFVVIVFSAIIIGFETDNFIQVKYHYLLHLLDILILWIFVFEIVVKLIAQKNKPWQYFLNGWNLFDFSIVVLSFLPYLLTHGSEDTHALMALRLIRLFRAFRIFRVVRIVTHLRPLQILIETLLKSLPSMMYVIIMLATLFYIYAIIGCSLFGKFDPLHFSNLGSATLSLFLSISGGDWPGMMDTILHGTEKLMINGKEIVRTIEFPFLVPVYFISFYFIGGLIILNLFIGVIVSELSAIKGINEREALREGFQDDLDIESYNLVEQLQQQFLDIQENFRKLQITLDKNKTGR